MIPTYTHFDRVLAALAGAKDLVIVDSPPGGEAIHLAALTAADSSSFPSNPISVRSTGWPRVFRSLVSVRQSTNPDIEILGVVVGRCRRRPDDCGLTR